MQAERTGGTLSERLLQEKSRKWQALCTKNYTRPAKSRVRPPKPSQPVEVVRRIVKDHGDLSGKKWKHDKKIHLGALKYLPHAIYKLLENMPMPWEQTRKVRVLYHTTGALTLVDEVPKVIEPVFRAQWSAMWTAMRREKALREHFKRMKLPPFDDEEPPLDFGDNILHVEPLDPVMLPLDPEEDSAVYDWFYDHQPLKGTRYAPGEKYRSWRLETDMLIALHRLARPLISEISDPNYYFLFDDNSFKTAKALNLAIPGGPKFEPMPRPDREDFEDDWNDFNDVSKLIVRQYIRTEYRISHPHLYNSHVKHVKFCRLQRPMQMLVEPEDDSAGPFYFDKSFFPLTSSPEDGRFPAVDLPTSADFEALNAELRGRPPLSAPLAEEEIGPEALGAFRLLFAPKPFQQGQGQTRRACDVPLVSDWIKERCPKDLPIKTRVSHQKLIKHRVLNQLHHRPPPPVQKRRLLKEFNKTKYFESTEMDWVEAGLQVVRQGYNMLNLMIHKRNLTFLHLDFNFGLKPVKTLTTKERKKSRFGNAFHLVREILRLTKSVVDCHVQYRLGNVDAFQLADALQYVFAHVGSVTGMYRYKYRMMRQVRMAKDLKHVIYSRFNAGEVGPGAGCGFWAPGWRVWLFFLRGMVPVCERWLGNLLARQFEGRHSKHLSKGVTKQRTESNYDLELRGQVMKDILDMMPEGLRNKKAKTIMQHLSEAWRCWKANVPWKVPGMPQPVEAMILRYVKLKADWWTQGAYADRERIRRGATVDKTVCKKNVGRLTRLFLKNEQERQANYLAEGPYLRPEEAVAIHSLLFSWLEGRRFLHVPFPANNYKHDTKLIGLALERLKETYSVRAKLNQAQREELALIEQAFENPHEALVRIKRALLTQRSFKEVKLQFMDLYTHLTPIHEVEPLEKITDAYLDQYLWYECSRRGLFPNWVKPADLEPPPVLVHKFATGINQLVDVWTTSSGEVTVLLQAKLERLYEKVDLTLLNRFLRLVMDPSLADYLTCKNNVAINFKDMTHTNNLGILHGLQFSALLTQFWGLVIDLLLLGLPRASQLAGPSHSPHDFMTFASGDEETAHPLRAYCRYIDRVYMVFRFSAAEARELVARHAAAEPEEAARGAAGYPNRRCWPRDARMRLNAADVAVGRAVFWEVRGRLPPAIARLEWDSAFVSVYSARNPNLLFDMAGFEVRIKPRSRGEAAEAGDGVWLLEDARTRETTAVAHLRVDAEAQSKFENRVRQILMASGSTTFTKIANKWNTSLIGVVTYFREALIATEGFLDLLVKSENRIQNRIKLGLNSKMPTRFPACVFYAPKELGGLGMLSMGHILIPQADMVYSKQTELGITHFRAGLSSPEGSLVPNLYRYIDSWESEVRESRRAWAEYAVRRAEAAAEGRRLSPDDLEDLWDLGVPRLHTLFQKDRLTLAFDRGWRVRQDFKQYHIMKQNPFWWTHQRHDGKLWALNRYRTDVIRALGGVDAILEHSLFRGTFFAGWEGLFWEKASGFEESMKFRALTHAQRSGLNQIPNRRFALWWSPTLNRANVYVGYVVQLDLTGIFMHGKLPTLKISLVQIFRAHLWQKIHESLVLDFCRALDQAASGLGAESVALQQLHPRKSYKFSSSAADILLLPAGAWPLSSASPLLRGGDSFDVGSTRRFWLDVQLRWGDFDSHDIERYARARFIEYTSDAAALYPGPTGALLAFDLAYNIFAGFGHWVPGLKPTLLEAAGKILRANPALHCLRERIRRALQLRSSEPGEAALNAGNYSELFGEGGAWIVDDSNIYRVLTHKTLEGNLSTRAVNGALFVLDPKSGKMYLRVVHASAWTGQKHLGQLAKWKAAEEVAALLRALPAEEQPRCIVVMRKGLLDPLESHLADFPNVVIKPSELQIPFQALLSLEELGDAVLRAPESCTLLRGVYDDWLGSFGPFTAFSRLALILRALHVSPQRAARALSARAGEKPIDNVWPQLRPDDWPAAEFELRNLILADFARKANVAVGSLTQTEIRDIILGLESAAETVKARQVDEVDKERVTDNTEKSLVQTVNERGERVVVAVASPYENQRFRSQGDWRAKALANTFLRQRARHVSTPLPPTQPQPVSLASGPAARLILPKDLAQTLVTVSDLKTQVGGFLLGKRVALSPETAVTEIKAIVLPPQTGSLEHVQFAAQLPPLEIAETDLELIGWVNVSGSEIPHLSASQLINSARILKANEGLRAEGLAIVTLGLLPGSCSFSAFSLTREGLDWATLHSEKDPLDPSLPTPQPGFSSRLQLWVSEVISGFFVVPENGVWNMNFAGLRPDAPVPVCVAAQPREFFHDSHRVSHFTNFARLASKQDDDELDEFIG